MIQAITDADVCAPHVVHVADLARPERERDTAGGLGRREAFRCSRNHLPGLVLLRLTCSRSLVLESNTNSQK